MTTTSTPGAGLPAEPELLGADELIAQLGLQRVLVIGAHPDDTDFGASATIAALTDRGVEVTLCVLTAGDAGYAADAEFAGTGEEIIATRTAEQQAAAAVVGVSEVIMLDEPDGHVQPTPELVGTIVELMRKVRPDAVISMHPERAWDRLQKSHPDHLACGEAVVRAVYPYVENPHAYPELRAAGLEPFKIRHLLLFGAPQQHINLHAEVTGFQDRKLEALERHLSQHLDPDKMRHYVLEVMRSVHGHGGYAEPFHHVVVNDISTIAGF